MCRILSEFFTLRIFQICWLSEVLRVAVESVVSVIGTALLVNVMVCKNTAYLLCYILSIDRTRAGAVLSPRPT